MQHTPPHAQHSNPNAAEHGRLRAAHRAREDPASALKLRGAQLDHAVRVYRLHAAAEKVHERVSNGLYVSVPNDARRDLLTSDIRAALQTGRPLQLVHQTDEERGGVPFSHFFESNVTPPELLQLKIYASIAIPMKAGALCSSSSSRGSSSSISVAPGLCFEHQTW